MVDLNQPAPPESGSSTAARLRLAADRIWRAQLEHPFVRGIGEGSVDMEQFRHWVRQDYLFLKEYVRLFALATARAPDLETMQVFARLAQETLSTEMSLHRAYAAEFGIGEQELEQEQMAPTTRAYTDFLLRTAALGEYAQLVAALLPCMWGFNEIGTALRAKGLPAQPQCAAWVEMYSSPEFAELAGWCRQALDRVAPSPGPGEYARLLDAFLTSSRYELAFWEMAARREQWPV